MECCKCGAANAVQCPFSLDYYCDSCMYGMIEDGRDEAQRVFNEECDALRAVQCADAEDTGVIINGEHIPW